MIVSFSDKIKKRPRAIVTTNIFVLYKKKTKTINGDSETSGKMKKKKN